MTAPDPAHNPILIGHDPAVMQVMDAFASGRLHHAWLIAGIEGIGKATLAWHIAHYVLSNGQNKPGKINPALPVAKLIMGGAHPDMLVIRRAVDEKTGELRNSIIAEDARRIAAFLHTTAAHSGWRVVLIDEAHLLNRVGQNTILKILEEPPPQALILITTTSAGALLPTIRSRCRLLQLAPLGDQQMKTILARLQPELGPEDIAQLVLHAGGSAGFALKIVRTETLPLYEELREVLAERKLDIARLHKLADQIGRKADAESYAVITALLSGLLRRTARARAAGETGGDVLPGAPLPLDRALQLWDKTRATLAAAENANLDRKLAFINAVVEIRQAA